MHRRVVAPAGYDNYPKRRSYYFKTQSEANSFAATVNRWKTNQTAPVDGTVQVDQSELRWLAFLRVELKDLSLLPEVVAHWKKTGSAAVKPTSIDDAASGYITYREGSTANKRTLNDIRWRLREFCREFSERKMHEISSAELSDYLETKTAGWARKSHYKRITQLFSWARKKSIVAIDPCETIDSPKIIYHAPEIYTVEDIAALLEEADENYKEIFCYIALSAFGFLRQAELVREYANKSVLAWTDFDWKAKTIKVRGEVAKNTGRKSGDQRYIKLNDNLIAFLAPYVKETGAVVEPYHRKFYQLLNECHESAEVDQISNGLRHSCLSYFIAGHPKTGIAETALMAGNSEAVARRHYLKSLTEEEGLKYWGLRRG